MKGFTLWFTGLSGSGKSTISEELARHLRDRGVKVEILDGDEVRTNLSKGLGFSKEDRDTNIRRIGLYKRALSGEIANFTGISDPYEEPLNPEIAVDTEAESLRESVDRVLRMLEMRGFVPAVDDEPSAEEEEAIRERLQSLGYL